MRVVLVDDDMLVSVSLKTILESNEDITVEAIGSSGEEAIELYDIHHPNVMLMDIRMDGMSGIQAGERILKSDKNAKILYLTTFTDDEYIVKALKIGARGYILKSDYEGISSAISAVMSGQLVFGEGVSDRLSSLVGTYEPYDYEAHDISDKEREIIELVAEGCSNHEISEHLGLSDGTIRNYISSLLDKLELRDRTQLAIYYYTRIS